MANTIERSRSSERLAAKCGHALAIDTFDGIFRLQLRHLLCLVCRTGWWESDGTVIGSTDAMGLVSKLTGGPRPTGWAVAEREWRRLADEGLAPVN